MRYYYIYLGMFFQVSICNLYSILQSSLTMPRWRNIKRQKIKNPVIANDFVLYILVLFPVINRWKHNVVISQ